MTVLPLCTLLPPAGSCLVNMPSGFDESVSCLMLARRPRSSSCLRARASVVLSPNVGTVTNCGSLRLWFHTRNPESRPSTTSTPMIDHAIATFFLCFFCATVARCCARVGSCVPVAGAPTCSNCPVTGLNA